MAVLNQKFITDCLFYLKLDKSLLSFDGSVEVVMVKLKKLLKAYDFAILKNLDTYQNAFKLALKELLGHDRLIDEYDNFHNLDEMNMDSLTKDLIEAANVCIQRRKLVAAARRRKTKDAAAGIKRTANAAGHQEPDDTGLEKEKNPKPVLSVVGREVINDACLAYRKEKYQGPHCGSHETGAVRALYRRGSYRAAI
ncbi:hypothetical protein ACHAQH_009882 [Verticillium albo-atrum]